MKSVKNLILKQTGLEVEVFKHNYNNLTCLYRAVCLYDDIPCCFELSEDGSHLVIYTDDFATLAKIGRILDSQRNKKALAYINDSYDQNIVSQFKYKFKHVTHEEYIQEYKKELEELKERLKEICSI